MSEYIEEFERLNYKIDKNIFIKLFDNSCVKLAKMLNIYTHQLDIHSNILLIYQAIDELYKDELEGKWR